MYIMTPYFYFFFHLKQNVVYIVFCGSAACARCSSRMRDLTQYSLTYPPTCWFFSFDFFSLFCLQFCQGLYFCWFQKKKHDISLYLMIFKWPLKITLYDVSSVYVYFPPYGTAWTIDHKERQSLAFLLGYCNFVIKVKFFLESLFFNSWYIYLWFFLD